MYIRVKPSVYECIQYTKDTDIGKLMRWSNEQVHMEPIFMDNRILVIETPTGPERVSTGDYIAKRDDGTCFAIDPMTFNNNYEITSEESVKRESN